MENAPKQGSFAGDAHMTFICNTHLLEMILPLCLTLKMLIVRCSEHSKQALWETLCLYIFKSISVNDIIAMTMPFAQQFQEINSTFTAGTGEPGKELIADMGAVADWLDAYVRFGGFFGWQYTGCFECCDLQVDRGYLRSFRSHS